MTLVLGLQCTDGVVLAAERSALIASSIQERCKKLYCLRNRLVVGIGGAGGMADHYVHTLGEYEHDGTLAPVPAAVTISRHLGEHCVAPAIQLAAMAKEAFGRESVNAVLAEALVVAPTSEGPQLIEINGIGVGECIRPSIPYALIGTGKTVAAPFLKYVKSKVWSHQQPNVATGVLTALWTMQYAIENDPYLIGPLDVVTVMNVGGYSVEELDELGLAPHQEGLAAVERLLKAIPSTLQRAEIDVDKSAPKPPSPKRDA